MTHVSQSSIACNPDLLLKATLDSGLDATTTGRHLICHRQGMEKEAWIKKLVSIRGGADISEGFPEERPERSDDPKGL
ncbi:MAG: hypothetical protein ACKOAU_06275 [Pirellula sp.]